MDRFGAENFSRKLPLMITFSTLALGRLPSMLLLRGAVRYHEMSPIYLGVKRCGHVFGHSVGDNYYK